MALKMKTAVSLFLLTAGAFSSAAVIGATDSSGPVVDLGYAKYQGYYNSTFNTTIYRGYVSSS